MRIVMKFGGTLIDSEDKIKNVIQIIKNHKKKFINDELIVIVSAINPVTDILLEACNAIKKKDKIYVKKAVYDINNIHCILLDKIINKSDLKSQARKIIKSLIKELEMVIEGAVFLGEVTPKLQDYIASFGERISVALISFALSDIGIKTDYLTGKEAGILTDSNFSEARPLMDTTKLRVLHKIEPLIKKKIIPIISGFIASDQNGNITTLGRGGSDYSATIIAASLNANEVWLWNEFDGMMTADPRIVSKPKVISELSFSEAVEMSMFGLRYMHPRALEPVIDSKTAVIIKNAYNLTNKGTKIIQNPSRGSEKIVKSITTIRNTALIDVSGWGMIGSPGTAAKIFDSLAKNRVNIMMISQSPSESSISMVVRQHDLDKAITTLELNFLGRLIKQINVNDNVSVIAVVGSGMRGIKGVAAKIFTSIAKKNINVIMITQGSSELNLAFIVNDENCEQAVRTLYEDFELNR